MGGACLPTAPLFPLSRSLRRIGGEPSFAYYEGVFAVANEAGVSIDETTCCARLSAVPAVSARDAAEGFRGAITDVSALSRLALERCPSARCAVRLMGELADALGYYAEGTALSEGDEALTVADGAEGYMFHVLPINASVAPPPKDAAPAAAAATTAATAAPRVVVTARASAAWVAMRLADGEASVAANACVRRIVVPYPSLEVRGIGRGAARYLASLVLTRSR
jgi:hypothetical protein